MFIGWNAWKCGVRDLGQAESVLLTQTVKVLGMTGMTRRSSGFSSHCGGVPLRSGLEKKTEAIVYWCPKCRLKFREDELEIPTTISTEHEMLPE